MRKFDSQGNQTYDFFDEGSLGPSAGTPYLISLDNEKNPVMMTTFTNGQSMLGRYDRDGNLTSFVQIDSTLKFYNDDGNQTRREYCEIRGLSPEKNGGVYFYGTKHVIQPGVFDTNTVYLAKAGVNKEIEWKTDLKEFFSTTDFIDLLITLKDNKILFAGISQQGSHLYKYSSEGKEIWKVKIESDAAPLGLTETSGGDILLIGSVKTSPDNVDSYIAKFSPEGNLI